MSRTHRLSVTLIVVGLTGLLDSASGQEYDPAMPLDEPKEVVELTLLDAIALGVENNLGVEIERFEPLIAAQEHRRTKGIYAPELFSDYSYDSTETPVATELQKDSLIDNRVKEAGIGLRGLLPRVGGGEGWATQGFGRVDTLLLPAERFSPRLLHT